MLLAVNDSIHSWSPIGGGDDEEVNISQDMCFMTIKPFSVPTNTIFSPVCPPLDSTPKTCLPPSKSTPSSTRASHSSIASSSGRRAQRNRNQDPSWIPRPRNAFIIFRCEYSREHAQGSQESKNNDDSTNHTVKTLSKCAAEAWKQLPPSERERYKVLADKEREEHARLYPHYRFRPMKRQISGTRKLSGERSQCPRVPSVERPPAPSIHLPSVLAPAPEKPRSSPSVERVEVSAPVPQVTAIPLPELSSYPIDPRAEVPLRMDYNEPMLSYPSPDAILPSASPSPSAFDELYAPSCMSAVSIPPDSFRCNDSASGVDQDTERAQALQAYAIGLYNYDIFSPFSFSEYY